MQIGMLFTPFLAIKATSIIDPTIVLLYWVQLTNQKSDECSSFIFYSRLEKLTEVLKEEIRTYQRSEERHKHIENLEYVKNVIMKFLTLTGTQEKSRLLPVLQTILKLKKEEVQQIEDFIKG